MLLFSSSIQINIGTSFWKKMQLRQMLRHLYSRCVKETLHPAAVKTTPLLP